MHQHIHENVQNKPQVHPFYIGQKAEEIVRQRSKVYSYEFFTFFNDYSYFMLQALRYKNFMDPLSFVMPCSTGSVRSVQE